MSLLSSIRSLLSELSLFGFPLLRKSKGYTLDSGLNPARSEKKNIEIPPTEPISPQNHCTGLSAPFQLNFKPSSTPQRTLQRGVTKTKTLENEDLRPKTRSSFSYYENEDLGSLFSYYEDEDPVKQKTVQIRSSTYTTATRLSINIIRLTCVSSRYTVLVLLTRLIRSVSLCDLIWD